jgi:hypothetical protein
MEVIAPLCISSILHLSVVVPMHWLAGKIQLARRNSGERLVGRVIDLVYDAFAMVKDNGSLLPDYDFAMSIFSPVYVMLSEFKEYLEYF